MERTIEDIKDEIERLESIKDGLGYFTMRTIELELDYLWDQLERITNR